MRLSPPVPSRLQFGSGIVQWSSPALDFGAAMAEDFSHNLENILHRMKVEILKEHEHEVQIAKLRTKALLGALAAGEFFVHERDGGGPHLYLFSSTLGWPMLALQIIGIPFGPFVSCVF